MTNYQHHHHQPLAITGMGIVTAIGIGAAETLDALLAGRSGLRPLRYLRTTHTGFPVGEVQMTTAEMAGRMGYGTDTAVTRTTLMGIMAAGEAMQQAALTSADMARATFICGTTVGGMDMSEQFYTDFLTNDSRNAYISQHDCGACTEAMARHFGRFQNVATLSTACSSAANAIICGANLLRSGQTEMAVVGGSECLTKFHLNGFNSLMILDHEACRPFDATRAGLNLGEGAAFLVIETLASAHRRGVKPIAVLEGYANTCDAFHQTASSPEGDGAYLSMQGALADAGLQPRDIDYVNAHGTGTPNNDVSESQAMFRVFGRDTVPPVSSTKAFTGHTTSASGSIEAVICILALHNQFLPLNLNWHTPMPDGVTPVTDPTPSRPLCHVLCNSFGFGGNDSSLIFGHLDPHYVPMPSHLRDGRGEEGAIYITAATQISIQSALSEEWLTAPLAFTAPHVRAQDTDFRRWLSPGESRRMGKLLKRAIATSLTAMEHCDIEHPDAIITGTGLGCVESTEKLLIHLCEEGEENCQPTPFMQSTHNTISSLVGIHTKSHGYNATYAHKDTSFGCAVADAWTQLRLGTISNALVGAHDEMTPNYFTLLSKTGFLGNPGQTAGETAVSIMLERGLRREAHALCRLLDVRRVYQPTEAELQAIASAFGSVDAIMTGVFGDCPLDTPIAQLTTALFPAVPQLRYKNIFGDSHTAFAFAVYASAHILHEQTYPVQMLVATNRRPARLRRILAINQTPDRNFTFVLLASIP